jgi:hypothetical protein
MRIPANGSKLPFLKAAAGLPQSKDFIENLAPKRHSSTHFHRMGDA